MATAGVATVEVRADTSKFMEDLEAITVRPFWVRPSLVQVVQTVLLLGILWRTW